MAILISDAAIFPSATLTFPANFLNPPLCLPVTFEPTKPIVDSARTTYSLAVGAGLTACFASVAVVLATLSAGSEQLVSKQVAARANRAKICGLGKNEEMWFAVFMVGLAIKVRINRWLTRKFTIPGAWLAPSLLTGRLSCWLARS